ncbi:ElyC/SanA/YdcF family protein [Actinoplanes sp. NPDC051861]|uniref:YdcF family protein n=1 Tax=Actinoplanes sp. NPDC051861 TaxID=3155170 RepID=UPI0034371C5B
MGFEVLPGTPGLTLASVAHVLVPGHGRNASASALTPGGEARCRLAASLALPGVIVCAGYKSPIDHKGTPFAAASGEVFRGVPEADLMRAWLVAAGVPEHVIRVERHSVDTVTNLLRAEYEGHFGDNRPVAIIAQRGHLRRILTLAPRLLRRPFLGVVVPGPTRENPLATPLSRLISAHLPPDPTAAIQTATHRAERLWRVAELLGKRAYH